MESNRTKKYVSHARNRRIIRMEDHLHVMSMRLLGGWGKADRLG
jgi:hypothetical protein